MQKGLLRIIDANYNRAREGLRVCEDFMRFLFEDEENAEKLKKLRRSLSKLIDEFELKELVGARDVEGDRLKFKDMKDKGKIHIRLLLRRNFQRVTEALRVLEEICLLLKPDLRKKFMRLRFKLYEIEETAYERI